MLRILLFACAMAAPSLAGAAQGIAFDGTDYRLARVSASDLELANYYAPSQTARRDEPTLSVRAFKGQRSVENVIRAHLTQVGPNLLDDPLTVRRENAVDDVVLISFAKTSDSKTVEYVLERFARANDGVISYRYAQRLAADADVRPVLARQPQRIEQLFRLNFAPREGM
ncbi:MAG: hypothetical protein AB7U81_15175 [Thiohalomonadaceae bacterium]